MARRAAIISLIAVSIPLLACVLAALVIWLAAPASTTTTGLLLSPLHSSMLI